MDFSYIGYYLVLMLSKKETNMMQRLHTKAT